MSTNEDRIAGLIAEFDTNGDVRSISTRLAEFGREAVEQLVPVLIAGESELCRTRLGRVFEHFGVEAIEPLVAGLRGDLEPKARDRLRNAIGGLAVDDRSVFLRYLGDPVAAVREGALKGFEDHEEAVLAHAEAILALMADPDENVRIGAYNTLGSGGPAVVPLLLRARRSAAPIARRDVRELLLGMVGFQGLDERDRVAIRRFLQVKAVGDEPEPMHLCGTWLAFPTTDQDAVLAALELSDPITVPMRFGADVWNSDHHDWSSHNACRRIYVTPALNGWTLAFGDTPEQAHAKGGTKGMVAATHKQVAQLSAAFGEVHWYGESCGDSWTSWCIARDGTIVRYYDAFEPDDAIGDPLPDEPAYATSVAEALSVNPADLGSGTKFQGRAVVALTSCGRERGMPRGAFTV